jgi:cysteinyl-tRNA synthetase
LHFLGFSGDRAKIIRIVSAVGTAHGRAHVVAVGASVDSNKVEELVKARNAARKAKNFKEADRIRDELTAMGIELEDKKDGTTTWKVKR